MIRVRTMLFALGASAALAVPAQAMPATAGSPAGAAVAAAGEALPVIEAGNYRFRRGGVAPRFRARRRALRRAYRRGFVDGRRARFRDGRFRDRRFIVRRDPRGLGGRELFIDRRYPPIASDGVILLRR